MRQQRREDRTERAHGAAEKEQGEKKVSLRKTSKERSQKGDLQRYKNREARLQITKLRRPVQRYRNREAILINSTIFILAF
jgi:hypothetical protein